MPKTLVIYFSNTGTTKKMAANISKLLAADTYELVAQEPYSANDLDWNNPNSRANREQESKESRPAYAGQLPDLDKYDTIIIGHPIWWGQPPRIIETLLEDLDLSRKTVTSFATSGGSTYSQSQAIMKQFVGPQVLPGKVLSSQSQARKWLEEEGLLEK